MGLEHLSSIFSVGIQKMHKSNVGSMYESGESNFSNIRDSFSLPDTATAEISNLSQLDAIPMSPGPPTRGPGRPRYGAPGS